MSFEKSGKIEKVHSAEEDLDSNGSVAKGEKIETIHSIEDGSDSDRSVENIREKKQYVTPSGIVLHDDDVDDTEPYINLELESSEIEIARRNTWYFRLLTFLWDPYDKHPKERLFLAKLDYFLMSSVMFGYFIKNLNQSNIQTAYINGMLEYYDMNSNQLNYMTTLFTVGYIIGQIPSNLLLHKISIRYYIGTLEVLWGILTMVMASCKSIHGVYAIRFILGVLESGYFPAIEYILGSWYSRGELGKRSTFFACAGTAASMVSGPLQESLLRRFRNSSLAPFKWLFIFDGIISIPIGIYTVLVDPNTPSTTNAWYFSKDDKLVALERRRKIGAQLKIREKYTLNKIKSFFNTWHIWVFPFVFLAYNNSCAANSQPTFTTWMRFDLGLSSTEYNAYPSSTSGLGIGVAIFVAYASDYFHGFNFPFVLSFFGVMFFGCLLLAIWNIPIGLHWFAYYVLSFPTTYGQPQIFAWVNRVLVGDDMKRNFVLAVTNTLAYVSGSFVPILVWNTDDQPRYFIGFTYTAVLCVFGFFFTILAYVLTRKDENRKAKQQEELEAII